MTTPITTATGVDDVRNWLNRLASAVQEEQDLLDRLDSGAGDGDHGATLVLGMRRISAVLDAEYDTGAALLKAAGRAFAGVGGSIGPLWGMAMLRASQVLSGTADEPTPAALADALVRAGEAMAEVGSARPGDRTLLDAFVPAAAAFAQAVGGDADLRAAARAGLDAALAGAATTAVMPARRGRASRNARLAEGRVDPGAASVALAWVEAVDPALRDSWRDTVNTRTRSSL